MSDAKHDPRKPHADKRTEVKIIYKSGAEVHVLCDWCKTEYSPITGDLTKLTIDNPTPTPLHMGVANIAAVWEMP